MRLTGCRLSLFLVSVALLAACATGPKMRQLNLGMPVPDVISIMGPPDGRIREGNYEALRWANRLISGWSWDRADYWVLLENGAVVAYGPGEVRERGPGVLIFIPLQR